jgi:ABC-type multidrug transport system ATPase subunit
VIILDEPTASLDAGARHSVHELIQREKSASRTFVLCTHLLHEAEMLCDHLALLVHGCLFTYGTPAQLASHFGKDWKIDVIVDGPPDAVDEAIRAQLPALKLLFSRDKSRTYSIPCADTTISNLFRTLESLKHADIGLRYFTVSSLTLENIVMALLKVADA